MGFKRSRVQIPPARYRNVLRRVRRWIAFSERDVKQGDEAALVVSPSEKLIHHRVPRTRLSVRLLQQLNRTSCRMAVPRHLRVVIAFAALYLIWGSTYLGILFAIQSMPPFLMAGTRFFLAGLIMFGIARTQGPLRSTWTEWRTSLIVGACLLLGGNGGVTLSEKFIESGLASLIVATVPIYITLLGWISGISSRPHGIVWLGLAGGFLGVAI